MKITPILYRKLVNAISYASFSGDLFLIFHKNKLSIKVKNDDNYFLSIHNDDNDFIGAVKVNSEKLYSILKQYRGGFFSLDKTNKKIIFLKNENNCTLEYTDDFLSLPGLKQELYFTISFESLSNALSEILLIDRSVELLDEQVGFDIIADKNENALCFSTFGRDKAIMYSVNTECEMDGAISILPNKSLFKSIINNRNYVNEMHVNLVFNEEYLMINIYDDYYYIKVMPCNKTSYKIASQVIDKYNKNKIIISLNDLNKCIRKIREISKENKIKKNECYLSFKLRNGYIRCDISGKLNEIIGKINVYSAFFEIDKELAWTYNHAILESFLPFLGEDINMFLNNTNEPLVIYNLIDDKNKSYFILMPIND